MTVYICGIVFGLLLLLDLVTKMLAAIARVHQGNYFLGIVRLNYTENAGFAFGMAADQPAVMIGVTVFTILLIIGIGILFFTVYKRNRFARGVLCVIEAGAIGNLIDRLIFGKVRDFIDVNELRLGSLRIIPTYICNVADIYIVFGAVLLIFMILFIGPHAIFPFTKKWREEAKKLEAEREAKKLGLTEPELRPHEVEGGFEEVVVFDHSGNHGEAKKDGAEPSEAEPPAEPSESGPPENKPHGNG